MARFYGYGCWDAPLWFVGMEEGGGESLDEIGRRLDAWDGSDDLADLREFHMLTGEDRWFRERPRIQSSWGKLIRTALCAEQRPCTTDQVRRYQRDELARRSGSVALIELFPLPSPSTNQWLYGQCQIPEITTRQTSRESLAPLRLRTIRERIATHQPRAVMFYGKTYRSYWEQIAATPFPDAPGHDFEIADSDATYILAPHPAAHGVTNQTFCRLGQQIAASSSRSSPNRQ
jgi:hypothetical protein